MTGHPFYAPPPPPYSPSPHLTTVTRVRSPPIAESTGDTINRHLHEDVLHVSGTTRHFMHGVDRLFCSRRTGTHSGHGSCLFLALAESARSDFIDWCVSYWPDRSHVLVGVFCLCAVLGNWLL